MKKTNAKTSNVETRQKKTLIEKQKENAKNQAIKRRTNLLERAKRIDFKNKRKKNLENAKKKIDFISKQSISAKEYLEEILRLMQQRAKSVGKDNVFANF